MNWGGGPHKTSVILNTVKDPAEYLGSHFLQHTYSTFHLSFYFSL
jgi:hypothetical protein